MPLQVIRKMIDKGQRPLLDDADSAGAAGDHARPVGPGAVAGGHDIPAVRHAAVFDLRRQPSGAYREAGDPWLPVCVVVDLPGDEPRTFRLLRAAHRLADVLGYVHVADDVHRHDPLYRMSTWHRVLPRAEAQALAVSLRRFAEMCPETPADGYSAAAVGALPSPAPFAGSTPAAALEDVLDLASEVPDAAVRVGPVVVVHATTADGTSFALARSLNGGQMDLLARAPGRYATTTAMLALLADGASASVPESDDELHLDRRVER
jgi:hypothetical protein